MLFGVAYAQVKDWGDCVVDGSPTLKCLEVVVSNIIFISSTISIIVLFVMLIVGGLRFVISAGNPEKIKNAKGTLTFALVGLGIFVGAYLIINTIDILFLGGTGKLLRFEIPEF